jgi:CubicO group peptidase (beta-lactamase class C family)
VAGSGLLADAAERLEAFARRGLRTPGLVVALVGPDGWRQEFAVGVADAGSGQPLATDALLPIASIGKAMTAVALLREAQAGRVDLDAAVHDQLPWLPLPTPFGPIRLRHLLAHTGGIVAGLDASPSPVVEALALAGTPPGWPAGERFYYSNVGYGLLGLVLEGVAGCSYAQAIQRHVLDPCGMSASEAVTTAQAQARAATGHLQLADGGFVPAPWVPTASGAGSTLCTAADLGRFLRALVAGEPPLLDPEHHRLMLTPPWDCPRRRTGTGWAWTSTSRPGTGASGIPVTVPASAATPTAAPRPGWGWWRCTTAPGGDAGIPPARGWSSTMGWRCCGRRPWAWNSPPTRHPPRARPRTTSPPLGPRPRFPMSWRCWSGPTPPTTPGCRSWRSTLTPTAACCSPGRGETRSP